jgi:hypothetical protein
MDNQELWNLIREAWEAILPHYDPVFDRCAAESGLDGPVWGALLAVPTFEPEATTPALLLVRSPYMAASAYLARLEAAAAKGYLTQASPGKFRLTDSGRLLVERAVEEARTVMAQVDPLPLADSPRLASILVRLVQACRNNPLQTEAWCINLSYKLMPPANPPLPYTEQALTCLNAYRDDAHLSAWKPLRLSATAVETLTLLWRGEANSLDAVCERLTRRGHPRQVYADALAELRTRGLAEGTDEAPRVTDAGRAFRDQVEADTDRYFFAPWAGLNDAEKTELASLLTRLRDGLKDSAA